MMNITKMGKTLKAEKFTIIFTKMWTEKQKLSEIFQICAFFPFLWYLSSSWTLIFPPYNWNLCIISILFLFLVLFVKKYIDFRRKLVIWRIESKEYNNFRRKWGRFEIQIKDDYYINWKNVRTGKFNVFLDF